MALKMTLGALAGKSVTINIKYVPRLFKNELAANP